ncbi:MAG: anti-sigma factor family protein [Gemmatimonadales bacterium]
MTQPGSHAGDALQLLLDERLPPDGRAAIEAHLVTCERCRRELDALRRVKAVVREALPEYAVPPELAARVSAALATEAAGRAARVPRVTRLRRVALAGLSLAAAALLVIVLARRDRPDFVTAAAEDLIRYRAAGLALQIATGDPQTLERFFAQGGIPFAARVFDLGMMGYRLRGGRLHRLAGRVSALFAYEGHAGERVLCQMYQGATSDLPSAAEEREHDGIRFRIYRSGGLTLVFWQEGSVVCVLAADGDPEAAIQLAYAKAVKV